MTPAQIDRYLQGKRSPLAGHGRAFVQAGKRYGIDPGLLVAITGAESAFGQHLNGSFNPFGWGPGISFRSFSHAIDSVARGLRAGYINEGRKTIRAIGQKWAPIGAGNDPTNLNSNWVGNVSDFYAELGGRGVTAGKTNPSVPPAALGVTSAPPDLSGAILGSLGDVASGKAKPTHLLASLTSAVAAAPPVETPAPTLSSKQPKGQPGLAGPAAGNVDALLNRLGLAGAVTSGNRPGAVTRSGSRSWHAVNKARDLDHRHPNFPKLVAYARAHPEQFEEFFFDPLGWFVKRGRIVQGAIGGHDDHGHVVLRQR